MGSIPYLVLQASAQDQVVIGEAPTAGQGNEPALSVNSHHLGSQNVDIVVEGLLVKVSAAGGVATVEEEVRSGGGGEVEERGCA